MRYADLIERKKHGLPNFPIQYYYVDSNHPQYIMQAHWHKEFEIIRVLKGSFLVFLNNIKYTLNKGDTLLVECGCLHRGTPDNCVYECVVFDLNMLNSRLGSTAEKYITNIANSSVGVHCLFDYSNNNIYAVINSLFVAMKQQKIYYELEVYSILFKLFALLYSEGYIITNAKTQHNHQTEVMVNLIDWIEKNFTEDITLDKLAEIAGLNKKYLCRIFKEYTSKTFINYINELKIENSCYEISVNRKNITQAAYDSGFNNLSYFCKTFKKHMGITPNEYKKGIIT